MLHASIKFAIIRSVRTVATHPSYRHSIPFTHKHNVWHVACGANCCRTLTKAYTHGFSKAIDRITLTIKHTHSHTHTPTRTTLSRSGTINLPPIWLSSSRPHAYFMAHIDCRQQRAATFKFYQQQSTRWLSFPARLSARLYVCLCDSVCSIHMSLQSAQLQSAPSLHSRLSGFNSADTAACLFLLLPLCCADKWGVVNCCSAEPVLLSTILSVSIVSSLPLLVVVKFRSLFYWHCCCKNCCWTLISCHSLLATTFAYICCC